MTSPEVGLSMPVMTLISVDLPLPDLPMMETKAPELDAQVHTLERGESPSRTAIGFYNLPQVNQVCIRSCDLIVFGCELNSIMAIT